MDESKNKQTGRKIEIMDKNRKNWQKSQVRKMSQNSKMHDYYAL